MSYYQPSQSLTWKYSSGTGYLCVVSTITVNLPSNEYLVNSQPVLSGQNILITITVGSSGQLILPPIETFVKTINTNLTKDQVRDRIKTDPAFIVFATVYKNSKIEGEAISISSSGSDIEMAG